MIRFYGSPPDWNECADVEPPEGLSVRADQRLITPVALTGMARAVGRPASEVAVARQLLLHFRENLPVSVNVSGYGTFRLGEEGWCLE